VVATVLAAVAALAILGSGCGGRGAANATTHSVGAYRIAVANRPPRPVVGDNVLLIQVRDANGKPVTGASVDAIITMPAMGAMPRMESKGDVKEAAPGRYEARYGLAMGGDWTVDLSVSSSGGGPARATYRLSTSTRGVSFEGGAASPGAAVAPPEADPAAGGAILVDPSRRQEIGIRTEAIGRRRLRTIIRAAGKVAYDETRRAEISLRFSGWVREIHVDYTGKLVRAGEPLLSVYSPELLAAQQELLEALRRPSGHADGDHAERTTTDSTMAVAARRRLLLWDIPPERIDAIVRAGVAQEVVPIAAPMSGVVVEKNVVRGSAFTAGQTLYKIAPVNPIWVVASVYQYELGLVREGMAGTIETPFLGTRSRRGRVSAINPYLDPETRTGEVRLEVANPAGDLKPGMFVDVLLERDLGERLAVPESAVLFEGDRRIVFVDLGDGRLAPREVLLGAKAGSLYEVRGGLQTGDVVVTSGNFLISAESRLRSPGGK
jgi:Cu(I)/Ag(I) efflux system membrane fusion protein